MLAVITQYIVTPSGERSIYSQRRQTFTCEVELTERLNKLGYNINYKDASEDLQRDVVHYNIPIQEVKHDEQNG